MAKNTKRNWSEQQTAIFNWFETGKGNLVVRARAGTGKTTTILEGIEHAPEGSILLAAFNKRIADELTTKLDNPCAQAKTLHSVGFGLVMKQWGKVRVDADRAERIARAVMGEQAPNAMVNLTKKLVSLAKMMAPFATKEDLLEICEAFDVVPDADWRKDGWDEDRIALYAHDALEVSNEKDGSIDFDDMVYLPVRNGWASGRFELVCIDEAQDMCATQIKLAQSVCAKDGRVIVVGDDRQAIYGFRGADSGSIDRLLRELNAKELGLNITYRCPKKVVEIAARLVPDYKAAPSAPEGVVRNAVEAQMMSEVEPGDFILSRKNAPLARICLTLLKQGKRAKIEGRDIGKGIMALIKQLKATSIPGLVEKLESWKEKEIARASKLKTETQRDNRKNAVLDKAELLMALMDGVTGLAQLQTRIADLFDDTTNPGARIVCSSVHRAKGLETNRVYLLADTLYPGSKGNSKRAASIEEANIHYVAVTRAKETLVLVKSVEA